MKSDHNEVLMDQESVLSHRYASYHTGTSFLRLNLSQTDLPHLDITLFSTRYVFFFDGGGGGYFSSSVSSVTVT